METVCAAKVALAVSFANRSSWRAFSFLYFILLFDFHFLTQESPELPEDGRTNILLAPKYTLSICRPTLSLSTFLRRLSAFKLWALHSPTPLQSFPHWHSAIFSFHFWISSDIFTHNYPVSKASFAVCCFLQLIFFPLKMFASSKLSSVSNSNGKFYFLFLVSKK